jgi:quinol monooxygenase YgiN
MSKALLAEFTVLPGAEARVAELVSELAGRVREEPGNVVFEVYTKADDVRAYWIYEVYRDDEAFRVHLAAPYGAPFNAQLRDLIEEDGSVLTFLTRVV